MSEWVAIMNGGVGLSKIASAMHLYPTLGEINKKMIGSGFSKKIFSDTVRKGLTDDPAPQSDFVWRPLRQSR